jgi:hypothetical protein
LIAALQALDRVLQKFELHDAPPGGAEPTRAGGQ